MNSFPQQRPNWWATYLKAGLFIHPAILLRGLSVVFVVPKVEQIFATGGGHPLPGFLPLMLPYRAKERRLRGWRRLSWHCWNGGRNDGRAIAISRSDLAFLS